MTSLQQTLQHKTMLHNTSQSSQPTVDIPVHIDELLRGPSDEHKLAGLLLVAKQRTLNNTNANTEETRKYDASIAKYVHNCVGDAFLDKLTSAESATTEEGESFSAVAMSVFSVLCCVPDIASTKTMHERIPKFLQLAQYVQPCQNGSINVYRSPDTKVSVDACSCLTGITLASPKGAKLVANTDFFPSLCKLCIARHGIELFLTLLIAPEHAEYIDLLQALLPRRELSLDRFTESVSTVATHFRSSIDSSKFVSLRVLGTLLVSQQFFFLITVKQDSAPALNSTYDIWKNDIRLGAAELLSSKIGPKERGQLFFLIDLMLSLCGQSWAIHEWLDPSASRISPEKFSSLVVSLAATEVRVLLDYPVNLNQEY